MFLIEISTLFVYQLLSFVFSGLSRLGVVKIKTISDTGFMMKKIDNRIVTKFFMVRC